MPPPPPPPPPPPISTPTLDTKTLTRKPFTPLQDRLNIQVVYNAWVKVFRILRLTFYGKSASKY